MVQIGACHASDSVMELKVDVNGLHGNVSGANIMRSIAQLHACGLISLSLQGNELSGSLTDDWGELSNLTALSLGKQPPAAAAAAVCLFINWKHCHSEFMLLLLLLLLLHIAYAYGCSQ
jgi:hypothetical protein